MVRKHPPVPRIDLHRPMPEIAHVDPVEPEPRRARGKRPRRASRGIRMDFRQATVAYQPSVGALAPVIEVAGDDERRIVRHFPGDEFEKPVDLPPAVRLPQSEVQADGMQWNMTTCHPITACSRPRGSAWPTDASTLRHDVMGCLE